MNQSISIGPAIKHYRKLKGVNQIEFAQAVGLTQTSISQIEKGHSYPKQDTIQSIRKSLDISPELLHLKAISFTLTDTQPKDNYKIISLLSQLLQMSTDSIVDFNNQLIKSQIATGNTETFNYTRRLPVKITDDPKLIVNGIPIDARVYDRNLCTSCNNKRCSNTND